MTVGRLALALAVWSTLTSTAKAELPALEVAVMPGPNQDELVRFALAHDLVDRLEPPGRALVVWVDPTSEQRGPRLTIRVAEPPTGFVVTQLEIGLADPLTPRGPTGLPGSRGGPRRILTRLVERSRPDLAPVANDVARQLGWRVRLEPPITDPEVAGLLLVLPERGFLREPSARSLELFLRAREHRDEPLTRSQLEAFLTAYETAHQLRSAFDDELCGASLIGAFLAGDLARVEAALAEENNGFELRGPGLASVLHLAASWPDRRQSLVLFERLLTALDKAELETLLEARDRAGMTPLLRALSAGNDLLAQRLLRLGARPQARAFDGVNVIHASLRGGLVGLVPTLGRRVPRALTQLDGRGLTPLGLAARLGLAQQLGGGLGTLAPEPSVDAVVGACARADLATASRWVKRVPGLAEQAALDALNLGRPPSHARWLAEPEEAAAVPLAFACAMSLGRPTAAMFGAALAGGRHELASAALLAGLPLDARADGQSLLHLTARYRAPAMARLLGALGGDPQAFDLTLSTPLELALDGGDLPTIEALLAVSARTGKLAPQAAMRALDRALGASADLKLVRLLSASLPALGPLERARLAVVLGDERSVRDLVAAHPEVLGDDSGLGLTLLHLAARFGQTPLIPILVSAGEPLDRELAPGTRWHGRELSGWTALHLAAFHGHHTAYQTLVRLGALQQVAADGTSPEDHLRFQMVDVGSIGHGDWRANLDVVRPADDAHAGVEPEIEAPVKPAESPAGSPPQMSRPQGVPRPSFIALGGGVLFDEAPGAELMLGRASVSGGRDELGSADGLEAGLETCLAKAERALRRFVSDEQQRLRATGDVRLALSSARGVAARLEQERRRMVVGRGPEVLAVARLQAARVELAGRTSGLAEGIVARALAELAQAAERAPVLRLLDGPVVHALRLARALALRSRGALSEALEALDAVRGEVFGAPEVKGRLAHWRGLLLGELGRYGDAIATLRTATFLRPRHLETRLSLATLLGRVGARTEARVLAKALVEETRGMRSIERPAALLIDGLLRLGDGELAARESVEAAVDELERGSFAHPAVGRIQLALARLARDRGDHADARNWLTRAQAALGVSDGEDAPMLGVALSLKGELARLEGRLDEALGLVRDGYALALPTEERELVWPIEVELARVYRALAKSRGAAGRGALSMAVVFGKRAVETLRWLRSQADAVSPEVARAFTEDRIDAWRELARDLADLGRYVEALAVLDGLRLDEARAVSGTTRGMVEEAVAPALQPERLAPPASPSRELAELADLSEASRTRELTPREKDRLAALRAAQRERRKAFEGWLSSLEASLDKLPPKRAQAIAALNLRDVSALMGTLGSLARFGPRVAVLHYVFAEDHVRVVVTTARGQVGRDGNLGGEEVMALTMTLREQLVDPTSDPRPVARELWRQLIGPIAEDLKSEQIDTLFFALDGPLRYLPMAALWDGERWLVERFRVAHLSRAALDKLEARAGAGMAVDTIGALGAAKAVLAGYAALPAVKDELEGVVKVGADDPSGVMPGEIRLDEAFTREALTAMLETRAHSSYHIASHFILGPKEHESFLLLGDGGRLTLEEIRYDLRFDGVDLLALSACNTAVGEERDGRELEGFASLALRLGARQVLATLWPVGDQSTGLLMQSLYRFSKDRPRPRSQSLRLAMLGHIRGEAVTDLPASGLHAAPDWPVSTSLEGHRHPFYWAPFILIGSWL